MTTIEKTLPAQVRSPQAAGFHKALALRALHRYREHLNQAQEFGADLSGCIQPPSYEQITAQYNELLDMWALDSLSDPASEMAATELVAAIMKAQEQPCFGGSVSSLDPWFAANILEWLRYAANERGCEALLRGGAK